MVIYDPKSPIQYCQAAKASLCTAVDLPGESSLTSRFHESSFPDVLQRRAAPRRGFRSFRRRREPHYVVGALPRWSLAYE